MNFEFSPTAQEWIERLENFMDQYIYPIEQEYVDTLKRAENPWATPLMMQELKEHAKSEGLWNLFLPKEHGENSSGLSNLEYAPLCEIMGRVTWSGEVFNCSAPDTGNMEVLAKYGSQSQQKRWLQPLLNGDIRSAFAMTEPAVASSDATNIETSIVKDGNDFVINGRKWFISGAMNTNCKVLIVMGKTDPLADRHRQQSQILVPIDTSGVNIIRPLSVLGYREEPFGHAEILFDNVRVPVENLILGEGRGFEIAQGRLGPGRIHHCMRLIGCAQRALEMACERVEQRIAFGKPLGNQQSVREDIARSFCEIEQARLLTLRAADKMDRYGNKEARNLISAIKIIAPTMAFKVIDRAIQMHGAGGLSDDFILASIFTYARTVRLADGPDQVHMMQLGRNLIRDFSAKRNLAASGDSS
ncbi:MAG: acyl-CoA dehydrogenase [Alphaproteobacteria bacterium]|nr:MAG: acyl-CoA dehydrogenase [Alphaproteobacteria bacterium]